MQNPSTSPESDVAGKVDKAKEMATKAGQQVVSTVRQYPVATAAVALGVGLLIGWWISRRSSSEK